MRTPVTLALALSLCSASFSQTPRPVVRVDDPLTTEVPVGPKTLAAEGAVRATAWSEVRNGNKDLYVSVSMDYGMSWGPERQATSEATSGAANWEPILRLQDGVLHMLFLAKHTQTHRDLVYKRSTDFGQSWSNELILTDDVADWELEVHGDRVLIAWSEFTPDEIFARWSTDKGLSFGNVQPVDPFNQGQYRVAEFDAAIVPFSGAGVILYEDNRGASRNLFLANGTPGAAVWGSLGRVDEDVTDVSTTGDPRIVVQGLDLHMTWHEYDRPGSNGEYAIYYRSYRGGVFQAEKRLGQYTYGVDTAVGPEIVANEHVVAVSWRLFQGAGGTRPYVAVSHDDGATFMPDVTIPLRPFSGNVDRVDVELDDHKLILLTDEHQSGIGVSQRPVAIVSGDGGLSWSDPIDFEGTSEFIDHVISHRGTTDFRDNMFTWVWGVDRNPEQEIRCSGLRFPVVEYEPVVGGSPKGILHLKYANPDHAGQLARWAASTAMGQVVHPENPALFLDLAPSGIYNQSLAKGGALTAVIRPSGAAQTNPIPIKPGLVGKRVFIQGWVNDGGIGQPASEVILATL